MVCTAPNGRIIGNGEVKRRRKATRILITGLMIRDFSTGHPRHASGMVLSARIIT
jgi:hypothetical protein